MLENRNTPELGCVVLIRSRKWVIRYEVHGAGQSGLWQHGNVCEDGERWEIRRVLKGDGDVRETERQTVPF